MTIDRHLYKRYQFFKAHAGYRVGYNSMDALSLARAEQWAEDRGIEFLWEGDYEDYENSLGDHKYWCRDSARGIPHTHEVYCCQAWLDDSIEASLGAIIEPSREYARVVEAELASEAYERWGREFAMDTIW